ncbi:MAG: substrate-binding domain-containing protein [Candidatus Sumerlaeia bacterium]
MEHQPKRWIYLHLPSGRHLADVAEGVLEYITPRSEWALHYQDTDITSREQWAYNFPWECVITSDLNSPFVQTLIDRGLPTVLVEHNPVDDFPLVRGDDFAVGRMAFDHMSALGLERFAYWGNPGIYHSDLREKGFLGAAAEAGLECYTVKGSNFAAATEIEGPDLSDWIRNMPKPVGMLLHYINESRRAAVYCELQGLLIPQEVCLLGVNNNDIFCRAASPSLSAIDQGCHRIGYRAAALIFDLMEGRTRPAEPILVNPRGVIPRESTSFSAIADPFAAKAYQYIQNHACEGIDVSDVVEAVNTSRRYLEKKFKESLSRTIHQEITRVRIDRARELLSDTHMDIGSIAIQCGFRWMSHMTRQFQTHLSVTPSQYRKISRGEEEPPVGAYESYFS